MPLGVARAWVMRAGLHPQHLHDEAEARVDRRLDGCPHGEGPPLPRPDFRAPPPPWLLPRPPSGAPPPPRPPPDTRVPPHLLTWDTIVSWPPPGGFEAPETLWHRDRDDRVPNEGEEVYSASDRAFAAAGETREGASEEEEEEEERFELNDAWLERFARTEIERRARAKERRKEARREERVVVPAAAAAAARVEKQLAERRERESATSAVLQ